MQLAVEAKSALVNASKLTREKNKDLRQASTKSSVYHLRSYATVRLRCTQRKEFHGSSKQNSAELALVPPSVNEQNNYIREGRSTCIRYHSRALEYKNG